MKELFDRLFGMGRHDIATEGRFLHGKAMIGEEKATVIGTFGHAAIDAVLALRISKAILEAVSEGPHPILFIADTQGQALTRHNELLGLNGYFAHIARSVDLARRCGHRLTTLINGEAVSGGFLAFGMLADRICALPGSEVRVMDLRAMSRVTKIELATLEQLARESPVFAPGVENFWRMGAIHEIWSETDNWQDRLSSAFSCNGDERAAIGFERGGRMLASPIAQCVADA